MHISELQETKKSTLVPSPENMPQKESPDKNKSSNKRKNPKKELESSSKKKALKSSQRGEKERTPAARIKRLE
jgi:hypothetical protein